MKLAHLIYTDVMDPNSETYLEFHPQGYENILALPVITKGNREGTRYWTWNGSDTSPTLRPSIKTFHPNGTISHFWLNDGICEYLSDSTDGNAGKKLPLQELKLNIRKQ